MLIVGVAVYRAGSRDWRQDVPCAPPGEPEARVIEELTSDEPAERRYRALFSYFVSGFMRHRSAAGSRVQYCGAGSVNTYEFNGLEGFARTAPLFAAWLYSGRETILEDPAGGAPIDLVGVLKRGILSGVDRRSGAYWGDIHDNDQRIVEAADIARVLWLTRTRIWAHLSGEEKSMVTAWLLPASHAATPADNWMLFPITISLVLADLDAPTQGGDLIGRAHASFESYRARYYTESGWFVDGSNGIDFYNAWGITYELYWIHRLDPSFEENFITQAIRESAALTEHLIGPGGIPIIGRSVCYRTAVPVPILAAGLLEPRPGPGPTAKPAPEPAPKPGPKPGSELEPAPGVGLRALDAVWRYFIPRGAIRDGALTQGYFGPDLRVLDAYSGGGSCQWGLRSLVLAYLHGADDAFWSGAQAPLPVEIADYRLEYPKLGWRIEGRRRTGEITVEILKNTRAGGTLQPYTRLDRLMERVLRRPLRPGNHEAKYEARLYSSVHPFVGDAP
jgi:hypothetical protein